MKNLQISMPLLYECCSRIQQEAIALSGITVDDLAVATLELGETLNYWLPRDGSKTYDDPYEALTDMLKDQPCPWPYVEHCHLHDLTEAQVYLAFAHGRADTALDALIQRPTHGSQTLIGYSVDDAVCFATYAAKALIHGKSLLQGAPQRSKLMEG